MSVVTDPTSRVGTSWIAIQGTLVVVSLALSAGCAQTQRFQRNEPPPMLGALSEDQETPPRPLVAEEPASPAGETYAEWLERRTPALHPSSAAARASATDDPSRSQAASYRLAEVAPPTQVALREPVALPTGSEAVPTASTVTPETNAPAERPQNALEQIRRVVEESWRKAATLDNYQVQMSRQEAVRGVLQPAENVQLSIRRDPKAVRLEWLEGPNKGREVIFNEGGLMHVNMPGTLVPRISLPPDSPLALKNSRHPISEAGFAKILEQIQIPLESAQRGGPDAGEFRYGGLVTPEPGAPLCHEVVRITPSGETWTVHIDDRTKLPYMVHAEDPSGGLLEHYVFRDVRTNISELTAANAFDHESRWGAQAGGLLQRLARGTNDNAGTSATSSPR